MKNNSENQRSQHLARERGLEMRRDAIVVSYILGGDLQRSCLIFNPALKSRVNDFLKSKLKLEIYNCQWSIQAKIFESQIYLEGEGCIYVKDKYILRGLISGEHYYMVKSNPTNSIYQSVCKRTEQYDRDGLNLNINLRDFYGGKINSIPVSHHITFDHQVGLNEGQNQAIKLLGLNSVTFVKGPPGCGKTRLIARLCKLLFLKGKRVIVGAVSNMGIHAIFRELVKQASEINDSRKIHEYNSQKKDNKFIQSYFENARHADTLNLVIFTSISTEELKKLEPEVIYYTLQHCICRQIASNKWKSYTMPEIEAKIELIFKGQRVSSEFFSAYLKAYRKVIKQTHIMVSTTVSSIKINQNIPAEYHFLPDVGIIDEAAQSSVEDTLCFLKNGLDRLMLVGDDQQLDPTVLSQDPLLKQTIFNICSKKNPAYFIMLSTQYRMHPEIAAFPSMFFYDSVIKNGIAPHDRLSKIRYFQRYPISFISHRVEQYKQTQHSCTVGAGFGKKNYANEEQIRIITKILGFFHPEELKTVGIITPYTLQLSLLQQYFAESIQKHKLTVRSCDGYQGGEKDYILVSCVRSNLVGNIGFCGDYNRVNVTLTRARKGLVIVGNANTLSQQGDAGVWGHLIRFLDQKGQLLQSTVLEEKYFNSVEIQKQFYGDSSSSFMVQKEIVKNYQIRGDIALEGQELKAQKKVHLESFVSQIVDEGEDKIQSLFLKNKLIVKKIRKILNSRGQSLETQNLKELKQMYGNLSSVEQTCILMTREVYFKFCQSKKHPAQGLARQLEEFNTFVHELKPIEAGGSHLKQIQDIYRIMTHLLIIKALELLT